ncbi:MAG: hypothetical protein AB1758_23925, partial [Candidatus Eremiobacterota bacterium]
DLAVAVRCHGPDWALQDDMAWLIFRTTTPVRLPSKFMGYEVAQIHGEFTSAIKDSWDEMTKNDVINSCGLFQDFIEASNFRAAFMNVQNREVGNFYVCRLGVVSM